MKWQMTVRWFRTPDETIWLISSRNEKAGYLVTNTFRGLDYYYLGVTDDL